MLMMKQPNRADGQSYWWLVVVDGVVFHETRSASLFKAIASDQIL
jgi:hypothetical protein